MIATSIRKTNLDMLSPCFSKFGACAAGWKFRSCDTRSEKTPCLPGTRFAPFPHREHSFKSEGSRNRTGGARHSRTPNGRKASRFRHQRADTKTVESTSRGAFQAKLRFSEILDNWGATLS